MSIFACIYGFFHCSCTENSVHAPFAWQWTHAWSNVCYLKPPHLVTHRIRNEKKKKKKACEMLAWYMALDLLKKFPLSFVWDSPNAETGSDSFTLHQMASNPSHRHTGSRHGTASKRSHKYTQTHTHAYMNTSIPSEPLWQINMPENHRDWFRTVFKLGQTRATVKCTVPPEARQQSILETNQNGKLVTRVSANLSVRHQNHTRGSL